MNSRANLFSRKKLNQKGQAFSTFQLLIAAVVALAILVLLLNIIGSLPTPGTTKPQAEAVNLIKSQINSPSELRTSSNAVNFTKEDSLNSKSIANSSGVVTSSQICVSMGDFFNETDTDFIDTNPNKTGDIVQYRGSGQLRVKLSVICDTGSELSTDLQNNGIDDSTWMQSDKCQELLSLNQTACVVALRFV